MLKSCRSGLSRSGLQTCRSAHDDLRAFLDAFTVASASFIQELYGNVVAGRLLSGFSRLFTTFLQVDPPSYTCRISCACGL